MIVDQHARPESIAVASGLILGALLDALIAKNLLTASEIREVTVQAMKGVGARPSNEAAAVADIIGAFTRHYGVRVGSSRLY
jgi:hypothetical protein